jgi:RNA polymerase sigma-70 factor (ECF subfamily)
VSALDFTTVYGEWVEDVARWIRALGGLEVDVDDLTQEVFVVVRNKLDRFDGGNLAGWLYRICEMTVRSARGRAWYRHFVRRRSRVEMDGLVEPGDGPAVELERREYRRIFTQLLARMDRTRAATFVLFEVEGYSGEEIARFQDVPVATVWTRLHYARKEFLALAVEYRKKHEV